MSKRLSKPLLIDMLQSIEKILDYTEGMSFDSFLSDPKTQDAVIRNIQILGEAANRLSREFKESHSTIEWSKIVRSRHIVTHQYDDVDLSIIWKIVTFHLPSLKYSLEKILKEVE